MTENNRIPAERQNRNAVISAETLLRAREYGNLASRMERGEISLQTVTSCAVRMDDADGLRFLASRASGLPLHDASTSSSFIAESCRSGALNAAIVFIEHIIKTRNERVLTLHDAEGNTPLAWLCVGEIYQNNAVLEPLRLEVARKLLACGVNPDGITATGAPLLVATVRNLDLSMTSILIEAGASVLRADAYSTTSLCMQAFQAMSQQDASAREKVLPWLQNGIIILIRNGANPWKNSFLRKICHRFLEGRMSERTLRNILAHVHEDFQFNVILEEAVTPTFSFAARKRLALIGMIFDKTISPMSKANMATNMLYRVIFEGPVDDEDNEAICGFFLDRDGDLSEQVNTLSPLHAAALRMPVILPYLAERVEKQVYFHRTASGNTVLDLLLGAREQDFSQDMTVLDHTLAVRLLGIMQNRLTAEQMRQICTRAIHILALSYDEQVMERGETFLTSTLDMFSLLQPYVDSMSRVSVDGSEPLDFGSRWKMVFESFEKRKIDSQFEKFCLRVGESARTMWLLAEDASRRSLKECLAAILSVARHLEATGTQGRALRDMLLRLPPDVIERISESPIRK